MNQKKQENKESKYAPWWLIALLGLAVVLAGIGYMTQCVKETNAVQKLENPVTHKVLQEKSPRLQPEISGVTTNV